MARGASLLWGNTALTPVHRSFLAKPSPPGSPPPSDFPASGPTRKPHLSASSNTTYSTLCSFRFISTATCIRRPGVAMILEGCAGWVTQGPQQSPSSHSPAAGSLGRDPSALPPIQTHMSGFSCRAENWSSILGRRGGVSLIVQASA